ncbi:MAG: hypothetical protein PHC64_08460 [Candidatus Gastranaerophilales bacterium]|nr:hypothetical protein [Candidatus Gastranaerophilales bacterium]
MINSLTKDSHITQSFRHSKFKPNPQRGACQDGRRVYSSATVNNNQGINLRKPAEQSFSGLSHSEDFTTRLCKNKHFKRALEVAAGNQVVFLTGFSLLLTGLIRPATIMALPSEKKNIDDKKYAAAQSISSGVIGFILALILANPIAKAFNKIAKNPQDYLNKNAESFSNDNVIKAAKNYTNQIPDILMAAPKAIITIAIIPPILKYIFGLEKKKDSKCMSTQDFSALNFNSATLPQKDAFKRFPGGGKSC